MNKIITFSSLIILSGFTTLPKKYRGITKNELISGLTNTRAETKKELKTNSRASKKRSISKKSSYSFNPTFENEFAPIPTLSRLYGTIEGNIVASHYPVTFKVNLNNSNSFPTGSYLSCTGSTQAIKFNYRIIAICETLITPSEEFQVNVGIKDTRLIEGIKPNEIYTGEEEAILGEGFSAVMGSLIDSKKDRIQTQTGFSDVPNIKNSYLNGALEAAKLANSRAKEHSDQRIVVLSVKHGTKVIAEFKRRLEWVK